MPDIVIEKVIFTSFMFFLNIFKDLYNIFKDFWFERIELQY